MVKYIKKEKRGEYIAMEWNDGKMRCRWANLKNPLYVQYHDEEWGVLSVWIEWFSL